MSSSNRIIKNSSMALLYEFIAIVAGLIVPRLILGKFGSSYNGIVSSVTQFLSFVVLLRAGIGGVAKSHLYKSLKDKDYDQTSKVILAVKKYMDKVCLIFLFSLFSISCIYPFIVSLPWLSTASLVLICGLSSLAENYFGITNMILLQADRKDYVISIGNIIATLLNVVITIILINLNCSIHIVKFGTAIAFSINPIFLWLYNKLHYKIDYSVKYDRNLLSQTKDAFVHVVAEFVHRNTDVIILTLMTNTLVVSVYSVHAIVVNGLRKLTNAFTSNIESVLGRLFNGKKEQFYKAFLDFEFAVFFLGSFTYSCCNILIPSFIGIYTRGVNDINYVIPVYGLLISVGEFFDLAKTPYQYIIRISGKFKETKVISIIEAVINIFVSIILVNIYGIVGVAVGTVIAMMWRTIAYSYYVHKNILDSLRFNLVKYLLFSFVSGFLSFIIYHLFFSSQATDYISFVGHGIIVVIIVLIIQLIISLLFYRDRFISVFETIKVLIHSNKYKKDN